MYKLKIESIKLLLSYSIQNTDKLTHRQTKQIFIPTCRILQSLIPYYSAETTALNATQTIIFANKIRFKCKPPSMSTALNICDSS